MGDQGAGQGRGRERATQALVPGRFRHAIARLEIRVVAPETGHRGNQTLRKFLNAGIVFLQEPVVPVPRHGHLIVTRGEFLFPSGERLIRLQAGVPAGVRHKAFEQVRQADAAGTLAKTGWSATVSLEEGLSRTVEWYRTHSA